MLIQCTLSKGRIFHVSAYTLGAALIYEIDQSYLQRRLDFLLVHCFT